MHDLTPAAKIKAVGLSNPRGCTIAVLFRLSKALSLVTYLLGPYYAFSRNLVKPYFRI